jgi:hypothetical protein
VYSQKITREQLAAAQHLIDSRPRKTDRYSLTRIPLSQMDQTIAHFNALLDDDGNLDAKRRYGWGIFRLSHSTTLRLAIRLSDGKSDLPVRGLRLKSLTRVMRYAARRYWLFSGDKHL